MADTLSPFFHMKLSSDFSKRSSVVVLVSTWNPWKLLHSSEGGGTGVWYCLSLQGSCTFLSWTGNMPYLIIPGRTLPGCLRYLRGPAHLAPQSHSWLWGRVFITVSVTWVFILGPVHLPYFVSVEGMWASHWENNQNKERMGAISICNSLILSVIACTGDSDVEASSCLGNAVSYEVQGVRSHPGWDQLDAKWKEGAQLEPMMGLCY